MQTAGGPLWFQLYHQTTAGTESMVRRAEDAGVLGSVRDGGRTLPDQEGNETYETRTGRAATPERAAPQAPSDTWSGTLPFNGRI